MVCIIFATTSNKFCVFLINLYYNKDRQNIEQWMDRYLAMAAAAATNSLFIEKELIELTLLMRSLFEMIRQFWSGGLSICWWIA